MEAVIKIHVTIKARRTQVVGMHGDAIKIHIASPPVDGRANEELISFLAKTLGVPKSDVRIKSGASSRSKIISINGLDIATVTDKLVGKQK